jgi:hypothetical protein
MKATLQEVRAASPLYFAKGNKKRFGDLSYRILHGKKSKAPYLIRNTTMWWRDRDPVWKINPINENLHPLPTLPHNFQTLGEVKEWLQQN